MRIAFVGGGTGGHFYPLIAVAEQLRKTEAGRVEMYYFGPGSYDNTELERNNISFVFCPAGKLRKYASIANFFDIFRTLFGTFLASFKLYAIMPDVVFSKGGFTSVPVLLAARFLRIPIMIHESDSLPGRANVLAKSFAQYIAISYPETAEQFPKEKTALTGIPIREAIKQPHKDPFTALGISAKKPLIFVTGGSTGAERINSLVLESLDELLPHYQIIHQTGLANESAVRDSAATLFRGSALLEDYYVMGTLTADLMSAAQTAASLIVSRAGSTSIFEIAQHGKPSIIIPIPETISRDQRSNAYAYARTGAASVLEEGNLTDALLTQEIHSIMSDAEKYHAMSAATAAFVYEGAAEKISSILISIGNEHR